MATLFRKRLPIWMRATIGVGVAGVGGTAGILNWGLFAAGFLTLFFCVVTTAALYGLRKGLLVTFLSCGIILVAAWGFVSGWLNYPVEVGSYARSLQPWVNWVISYFGISVITCLMISWIHGSLLRTIDSLRQSESQLALSNEELAKQAKALEAQAAELRHQHDMVMESSRAKDRFLSAVSHELRTPLNPMLGFIHFLRVDEGMSYLSRGYLDSMNSSAEQLLRVIDDVVDYSELSEGRVHLEVSTASIGNIVREALARFSPQIESKGLELQLSLKEDCEQAVRLDQHRMGQVLDHLLENAIKFTNHGVITVRAMAFAEKGDDSLSFCIEVQDTGIGLSEADAKTVFQPFVRRDCEAKGTLKGLGLGLSRCRKVMEAMGGSISLSGEIGKGTLVTLKFAAPINVTARRVQEADPVKSKGVGPAGSPWKVLVVEDDFVNQQLAKITLGKLGVESACSENGELALEALDEDRYDLVLMDMSMPVMDGVTATREIRKRPEWAGLPIVGLTAHTHAKAREACLAAGMDRFLTKPLRRDVLLAVLNELLGVELTS